MVGPAFTHRGLLGAFTGLVFSAALPVSAQRANNNTSPLEGCGMHAQSIAAGSAYYNSTGSTPFSLGGLEDEWHLSYGLIDERQENHLWGGRPTMQTLAIFLSVPEDFIGSERANDTDHCVYLMPGRNETSDAEPGDGNESCTGVLSEDCITALRAAPSPNDGDCPRVDVGDACGFSIFLWRSEPSNFTESRCSVDEIPGIQLPSDYRSYDSMVGTGILPTDDAKDSFERYDLRVQQPVPLLVTSRTRQANAWLSDAQVICLAPSNVTDGSREPEGDFPPDSAAASPGSSVAALGLCVVAVVVFEWL